MVISAASTSAAPPHMQRLVFIDVARSVAIFVALCAHAVAVFGVWPSLPPNWAKGLGNFLFFSATPTFFLLFGVMLELVYVNRGVRDGPFEVGRQLGRRAALCWAGLCLGGLCALWSGRLFGSEVVDALLGLVDTPNSGILRFYAVAMLLVIPVVIWRPRLGVGLPLALIGLIWLVAVLLPYVPWPGPESRYAFICGFLAGHPPIWTGGSLWHNLSIVFLGMIVGHIMRQRQRSGLAPFGGLPMLLIAAFCLAGMTFYAWQLGPHALLREYLSTSRSLRSACHPAYFLISTLSAMSLIWLMQTRYPASTRTDQVGFPILSLGRHSLAAFAGGNAVLNLFPPNFQPHWILGVGYVMAFLAGVCVFTHLLDLRTRTATPGRT